jgi:hypothetical protein
MPPQPSSFNALRIVIAAIRRSPVLKAALLLGSMSLF